MQFETQKKNSMPPEGWLGAARGASEASALNENNMEIKHCKNIWNYYGILKTSGLLMNVDALSTGTVDLSLVFIPFAERRKSIMQKLSPVQKC